MLDVVACGELLIDFTPMPHPEPGKMAYEQNPGGAVANVLAALSRFHKKTAFLGAVGNDAFGRFLKQTLMDLEIGTDGLVLTDAALTTLAFVHIDASGERSFSFARNPGADTQLREADIDEEMIAQARLFHFGSLSLTHEPARSATWKAVDIAKRHKLLVSFDPNIRESLWPDMEQAKAMALHGIRQADIVKLSEEELELLAPASGLAEATEWLMETCRHQAIFVTRGKAGCYFRTEKEQGMVPGYAVDAVDTTGAGDAFLGGLLYQVLEAKQPLRSMDNDTLTRMVRFANAAGALTTTRTGAIPALPALADVERFVAENRI
ncbi:carbohydrate kinase family protein [Brevibacillus parabrevis]|jgi:Sugar kinases, ribokinase family|uniref:Fructokinase n=1 Tax=Brevibacillus parabrevis TaxID=54914 RepID=A0A4Y3PUI9_BREPA|nr:carbohydrate kinase [Brevibacillus parabrevis]RNB95067.1 carbohydrate kinase [Brevibacillus parabrevis]GEB34111.1 fructokinase [Brevibacillus parabrevis]